MRNLILITILLFALTNITFAQSVNVDLNTNEIIIQSNSIQMNDYLIFKKLLENAQNIQLKDGTILDIRVLQQMNTDSSKGFIKSHDIMKMSGTGAGG